jgi:hypothetical protein
MGEKKDYKEGYFDDLIGHKVHVECSSWPHDYAEKMWGPDFITKTSVGEIRQVKQNRQTGLPKFHIMFRDTDQTYTNLDLDYVLRYSIEVPVKYHLLKAEYIVRKAREASALAKPSSGPRKKGACNERQNDMEDEDVEVIHQNTTSSNSSSMKKRGGQTPVLIGLQRKQALAQSSNEKSCETSEDDDVTIEDMIDVSDIEEEDDDEPVESASGDEWGDDEALANADCEPDIDAEFINWQYQTLIPDTVLCEQTGEDWISK